MLVRRHLYIETVPMFLLDLKYDCPNVFQVTMQDISENTHTKPPQTPTNYMHNYWDVLQHIFMNLLDIFVHIYRYID